MWFDDAPMLLKTSAGIVSVKAKSDVYIAIGGRLLCTQSLNYRVAFLRHFDPKVE